MSDSSETFFTRIGCMDGRCQELITAFGRHIFEAQYPDTITDAGIVGIIAENPTDEFLFDLRTKLIISLDIHHSKGIIVFGHDDCAGDPVDEKTQKEHIRKTIETIHSLVVIDVPIIGAYIHKSKHVSSEWIIEELPYTPAEN